MKLSNLNSIDLKKLKTLIESINQNYKKKRTLRNIHHVCGHATAIYLNNKSRNLPPIYFQIRFIDESSTFNSYDVNASLLAQSQKIVTLEGGRLINSLPTSINVLVPQSTTENDKIETLINDVVSVFETDVMNILIGPLAEAKFALEIDNEPFSLHILAQVEHSF